MAQCIYFEPLGASHARVIAHVERAVHREHNVHGRHDLREELEEAETKGNLSLGMRDGGRLVGYVLYYLEPEGCEDGSGEPVVYVSDLAILPGYRRYLGELVGRAMDRMRSRHPAVPLEVHSFAPELEKWRHSLDPLLAHHGYRVTSHRKVDEEDGLERFWARFEPVRVESQDPWRMPSIATYEVDGERYDVRVIQNEFHWARLEPYWNDLVRATPRATGFQSFEYQTAWWRCFGMQRRRLLILTFWHGHELRGIAPLVTRAVRTLAGWTRELSFIGTGWEVDRPVFLFGRHAEACTELLRRCLAAPGAPWDRIHLFEQHGDASYVAALRDLAEREGYFFRIEKDTVSAFLRLEGSFEDFLASRSRHFRKRARTAVRRLRDSGELVLERCATWPEVGEALARYRDLETRSWKHGDAAGVGETQRSAFYDELLRSLGPKEQMQVLSLRLDGRLIASTIAMVFDRTYYSLQIVHDAEFDRYSPGTALEYLELEDCFASPCTEYDFLGGHLNNKQRWTSSMRATVSVYLARRSPATIAQYAWLRYLRPWVLAVLRRTGFLERALKLHVELRERVVKLLNR